MTDGLLRYLGEHKLSTLLFLVVAVLLVLQWFVLVEKRFGSVVLKILHGSWGKYWSLVTYSLLRFLMCWKRLLPLGLFAFSVYLLPELFRQKNDLQLPPDVRTLADFVIALLLLLCGILVGWLSRGWRESFRMNLLSVLCEFISYRADLSENERTQLTNRTVEAKLHVNGSRDVFSRHARAICGEVLKK
jgi:hypothetical protein